MIIDTIPLYQLLARKLESRAAYRFEGNSQKLFDVSCEIQELVYRFMPHGNGIDFGTKIDLRLSDETNLIFYAAFHHLDKDNQSDEWTEHTIIVQPPATLTHEIDVSVTGYGSNEVVDKETNALMYSAFYETLVSYVVTET